jgi:hypothetical protein
MNKSRLSVEGKMKHQYERKELKEIQINSQKNMTWRASDKLCQDGKGSFSFAIRSSDDGGGPLYMNAGAPSDATADVDFRALAAASVKVAAESTVSGGAGLTSLVGLIPK